MTNEAIKTEHTPLPWSTEPGTPVVEAGGESTVWIKGPDGIIIARVYPMNGKPGLAAVDAAFIVKATAMHDELVETCRKALSLANEVRPAGVFELHRRNIVETLSHVLNKAKS